MSLQVIDPLNLTDITPRVQVEIQTGFTLVELPNGYVYDGGDVVDLTVDTYNRIDADSLCATPDDLDRPVILRGFFSQTPGDRFVAYATGFLATVDVVGDELLSLRAPFDLVVDSVIFNPVTAAAGDITVEVLTEGTRSGAPAVADNEVQTLTRTSTGGTIRLTFDGQITGTIPATAAGFTAAAVEAALEALSNLAPADVAVTGSAGGPLTVTFGGAYAGVNVPQLVVDNTSATGGTIVAATLTEGDPAGTPVTIQINTAAIDANSGSFGPNREVYDATEADVAEGELITLETTTVSTAFSAGAVGVLILGSVA